MKLGYRPCTSMFENRLPHWNTKAKKSFLGAALLRAIPQVSRVIMVKDDVVKLFEALKIISVAPPRTW